MLIRRPNAIASSGITPEREYVNRRDFLARAGGMGAALVAGSAIAGGLQAEGWRPTHPIVGDAAAGRGGDLGLLPPQEEKPNSLEDITTYNNFYEFGTDKDDPARNAGTASSPRPGRSRSTGWCKQAGKTFDLDDLLEALPLEERVYRMRCVEAWSMVIPWVGLPAGATLLKRVEPTSQGEVRRVQDAAAIPSRCRDRRRSRPATGRTSKACGWTRRCTR